METVQGFDFSFWQDDNNTPTRPDPTKAKAAGAEFVFIRAGQDVYPDPDFQYNWAAAKCAGLLRGAYQFYDYRHNPTAQADAMIQWLSRDPGELPPVLDIEIYQPWGQPLRANILPAIQTYLNRLEAAIGKTTIIYSNPDMILHVLHPVPDWLLSHPLWVAHYGAQQPTTGDWPVWKFWQYSSHGDGPKYGMESLNVDLDYWNGTLDELRVFSGVTPAPLTTDQRLSALEEWARGWNFTG